MQTYGRYLRIAACACLAILGCALAAYEGKVEDTLFGASTADYLASLRESSERGCTSFGVRKPALLVVGDSHSYAGFNFNAMASALGSDDVACCAMGGFRIESWKYLVPRMRRGTRRA